MPILTNNCPFCGVIQEVAVSTADFVKYKNGALIQDAFPSLTPSKREVILTGICDNCWPKPEDDNE
jgi:hypothetical protein